MLERALHRLHARDALLQIGGVGERDALHVGARATAIGPELQQCLDLVQAEAEVARAADEAQRVHRRGVVLAVAGSHCVRPAGSRPRLS